MIVGDLIELRPSDLRRARDILADLSGVLEVQTYGDLIHVFVPNAKDGTKVVTSALEEQGITVINLRQATPRMEEAFIYLIRRQGTADQETEALLQGVNAK
jgi:ABC-2 type transport system ATP-binding protein